MAPAPPKYDKIEADDDDDDDITPQSFWILTREQLAELTEEDRSLLGVKPEQPLPIVIRLYAKYSRLVQRLDACWNETYQVQKNQAMHRILDAALARLTELKDALTDLDMSQFHYIDGVLVEMKLVPRELEVINLSGYPIKRQEQLQELAERLYRGERIYEPPPPPEEVTEEVQEQSPEETEEKTEEEQADKRPSKQRRRRVVEEEEEEEVSKRPVVIEKPVDPVKQAQIEGLILIQQHERARQGRLEFHDEQVVYIMRKKYEKVKPLPKDIGDTNATQIQKLWRGYVVRRDMKKRDDRGKLLISMEIPSWRDTSYVEKIKEAEDSKRKKREEKVKEYLETCNKEKERVIRVVGPGLMEDIGDEIRLWFRNWYDVALAFDKYPPEEEGGTIIVVRGDTLTPEEYREEQEKKRVLAEKLKNNPALAKKFAEEAAKKKKEAAAAAKKEKQRIKKEKKEAKLRAKRGEKEPFMFKETNAMKQIQQSVEQFDEDWTPLDDEIATEDQPVMDKITSQKCYEVQLEMRKIVDEMMRLELAALEDAFARDRAGGKPVKAKPKPKAKKGKKKKKGKKDPTGTRTTEDLFQELYDCGIIRNYPAVDLDSFIGEYAFKNMELRAQDLDPLPSVGDIKKAVNDNCILPLGGEMIPKPASVCICGPRQSGKKLLVNAICTATSSVMFDLSPPVLVEKYPGKAGNKKLIHLINKMSRILQPTVLFIDGAEKTFWKKVPKPEKKFDPKRLKKQLFKGIVKSIKHEDRVMVIGICREPWACTAKPFLKAYQTIIMIPRTDYGTVYQLWMDILMKYHGIRRDMDISSLAMVSIGYPIPYIRDIAKAVLTARRIVRLKYEPLRQHEVYEALMRGRQPEPVTKEEQDKFTTWFNSSTKLGKDKTKMVQAALELKLAEEKAKAKAKK